MSEVHKVDEWPALPYEEWRDTRDTLHMYTQVMGKLRLALSPFEPEWANVPLYVSARGLTTSSIPVGLRAIDAEFDFIDHALVMRNIPHRWHAASDLAVGDRSAVIAQETARG